MLFAFPAGMRKSDCQGAFPLASIVYNYQTAMADYYYAEMLFDPDETRFPDVVEGVVGTLLASGCHFRMITLPKTISSSKINWGGFSAAGLDRLREMCEQATSEGLMQKRRLISFPPGWGRIMFRCDFAFDEELHDEIWDEEEDTGARSTDLGLAFTFSPLHEAGRYTRMTLSFWEDCVLQNGEPATHINNTRTILNIFEMLSQNMHPYFGVMNNELHVNPDRSLDRLKSGELPDGNEYVYVGQKLTGLMDMAKLSASGRRLKTLPDGGVIIEFTDRWGAASAL